MEQNKNVKLVTLTHSRSSPAPPMKFIGGTAPFSVGISDPATMKGSTNDGRCNTFHQRYLTPSHCLPATDAERHTACCCVTEAPCPALCHGPEKQQGSVTLVKDCEGEEEGGRRLGWSVRGINQRTAHRIIPELQHFISLFIFSSFPVTKKPDTTPDQMIKPVVC